MAFIRKTTTTALALANRANANQSTGPRTDLGKTQASRNARKFLVHGKVSVASMKELGEDPQEFEKVRQALWEAFGPQDSFEEMLVNDLAELRWRRQRLLRAESARLASRKRGFEITHQIQAKEPLGGGRAVTELHLIKDFGYAGLAPSEERCSHLLEVLSGLRMMVECEGFREDCSPLLILAFGELSGMGGTQLKHLYERFRKEATSANPPADDSEHRRAFLAALDEEIAKVEEIQRLCEAKEKVVTPLEAQAELLPKTEELEIITRYEAALERQFERKLHQLAGWRSARSEGSGSASRAGKSDEDGE